MSAMITLAENRANDDYVIATGESHSVGEFVATAFEVAGISSWEHLVTTDPSFVRPADGVDLVGDPPQDRRRVRLAADDQVRGSGRGNGPARPRSCGRGRIPAGGNRMTSARDTIPADSGGRGFPGGSRRLIALRRRQSRSRSWVPRYTRALWCTDLVVVVASVALAQRLRFGPSGSLHSAAAVHIPSILVSAALIVVWMAALAAFQTYDRRIFGSGPPQEYSRVVTACFAVFGGLAIVDLLGGLNIARGYLALASRWGPSPCCWAGTYSGGSSHGRESPAGIVSRC